MLLKIGQLAAKTGISIETIRYYEKNGLIPAAMRSANNYRHYSEQHLQQLMFVSHCREINLSLDSIRQLLALFANPQQECGQVNAMIDAQISLVNQKIESMLALKDHLSQLRSKCHQQVQVKDCAILNELKAVD